MRQIKALIWNEWQRQRSLIYLLSAIVIGLWLLAFVLLGLDIYAETVSRFLAAAAIGLPLLFCFVLADGFGHEYDRNTTPFLGGLPVSPAKIFWSKYLYSLTIFSVLTFFSLQLIRSQISFDSFCIIVGANKKDIPLLATLLIVLPFLFHAAVFFFALVGRSSGNGIAALLLLPLVVTCTLPWLALALVWVPAVNVHGFMVFLAADGLVLTVVFVVMAYYLWTRRLSCGRSVGKPLWWTAAATMVLPWVGFAVTYGITALEMKMAYRTAENAGMVLDPRQFQTLLAPGETDITPRLAGIKKALDDFKLPDEAAGLADETFLLRIFRGKQKTLPLTPENSRLAAQALLENPDFNHLTATLREIAAIPNARMKAKFSGLAGQERFWVDFDTLQKGVELLLIRSVACRWLGRIREMAECWQDASLLTGSFAAENFWVSGSVQSRLRADICKTVIANAVLAPDFIPLYRNLISDLDHLDFSSGRNDASFLPLLWKHEPNRAIDGFMSGERILFIPPTGMPEASPWQKILRLIALPRTQHRIAQDMRTQAAMYTLFQQAMNTPCYKDIKERHDAVLKKYSTGRFTFKNNSSFITSYFYCRSLQAADKAALALLIYRIEHGAFPKKLAELKGILPEIPVSAFSGKPLEYRRDGTGFILADQDIPSGLSCKFTLRYQPWPGKTTKEHK